MWQLLRRRVFVCEYVCVNVACVLVVFIDKDTVVVVFHVVAVVCHDGCMSSRGQRAAGDGVRFMLGDVREKKDEQVINSPENLRSRCHDLLLYNM